MKQITFYLFIVTTFVLFISCAKNDNSLPVPKIDYGMAVLQGKISGGIPDSLKMDYLEITVSNAITSHITQEKIRVYADGTFSYSIDLPSAVLAYISSPVYENLICLAPNSTTTLDIIFDENGSKQVKTQNIMNLSAENLNNINAPIIPFSVGKERGHIVSDFDGTPHDFGLLYVHNLDSIINHYPLAAVLTNKEKILFSVIVKQFVLNSYLVDWNYVKSIHNFSDSIAPKSYYSFLKYFDLNNPINLYNGAGYLEILQKILENVTFNIPPINEMPCNQWLNIVNGVLDEYIGNKHEFLNDMLVSTAYMMQLKQMQALSDIQKQNISNYFQNKSFVTILFAENEKVKKSQLSNNLIINTTPKVDGLNLMDSIISKYKGNVVVVDFWATWCMPCLQAMEQIKQIKPEFQGKPVIFVYITNSSSPKSEWENRIKEIGGEQYYLNDNDWEYLLKIYNFDAIPTYLIFDKKGKLSQKFTGYPGNETMQEVIEKTMR